MVARESSRNTILPAGVFGFPQVSPGGRNIGNRIGVDHDGVGASLVRNGVLVAGVEFKVQIVLVEVLQDWKFGVIEFLQDP